MTGDDLDRIKASPAVPNGMRCAVCGEAPTCPHLHDAVWREAWAVAKEVMRDRLPHPTDCTCPPHSIVHIRPMDYAHTAQCKIRNGIHDLLCFDCTELLLRRPLELADLAPAIGNYATFVMMERARE